MSTRGGGNKGERHELDAVALCNAVALLADSLERADTEVLEAAHKKLGEYFMRVTEGRKDNTIEQRLVGTLWAEVEQALDARRKRDAPKIIELDLGQILARKQKPS